MPMGRSESLFSPVPWTIATISSQPQVAGDMSADHCLDTKSHWQYVWCLLATLVTVATDVPCDLYKVHVNRARQILPRPKWFADLLTQHAGKPRLVPLLDDHPDGPDESCSCNMAYTRVRGVPGQASLSFVLLGALPTQSWAFPLSGMKHHCCFTNAKSYFVIDITSNANFVIGTDSTNHGHHHYHHHDHHRGVLQCNFLPRNPSYCLRTHAVNFGCENLVVN